jgi:hypothetical protein
MLLLLALSRDLADAFGLIIGIVIVEIAREIRAYSRGQRLRYLERDISLCLLNHKTARQRKKAVPTPPPVHGNN